jgi:hypothetical protein
LLLGHLGQQDEPIADAQVQSHVQTASVVSVDVLWYGGDDFEWIEYEIYDIEGNGSHTFAGFDFNRDDNNINI